MSAPRWLEPLLLTGALADGATGLGLLFVPERIMGILRIPLPPPLLHARLIGAFVGSVGLLYFLAWRRPAAERLVLVEALTFLRAAVCLTTTIGVALGGPPGYLVVGLTDGTFAALQLAWLWPQGRGRPWR